MLPELGALEDELAQEESEELPAYLLNAASASKAPAVAVDASPIAASASAAAAEKPKREVAVDAFGLPDVPLRNLNA
jgi:hypothetical protein